MNRETDLTVSTYGIAKDLDYEVIVLPWGATEPHNWHLPYMTDCILSHAVAADAAQLAFQKYNVRCMVMPPITLGSQNPGQRELPFCIHGRYETQKAILTDIVSSLHHQGFRKLFIINGHGGNNFKNMIRDLSIDYPNFLITVSNWFNHINPKDFFTTPGDHADEVETSVMMHYHPELVRLDETGNGKSRGYAIKAMKTGNVWMHRLWDMVSHDTGIGAPHLSTAEKGKKFANAVCENYAEFLRDFAKIEKTEDFYEAWP